MFVYLQDSCACNQQHQNFSQQAGTIRGTSTEIIHKPVRKCLKQMIEVYNQQGGNVIAVEDVAREDTDKYGIVDTGEETGKVAPVKGLVEKPIPEQTPSTLLVVGRYILQPEIFEYLAAFETDVGGEIQLTDAIAKLIGKQAFSTVRFEEKSYD